MSPAAEGTPSEFLVSAGVLSGLIGDIAAGQFQVPGVPFGVLLGSLARRFAGRLAEFSSSPSLSLVIERMGAERNVPLADGDRLSADAIVRPSQAGATATLILTKEGAQAFRCDLHLLALSAEQLFTKQLPVSRQRPPNAVRITVSPDQLRAYADISGDFNPLHLDRERCAALGLPERIVHGTLLTTLAEAAGGGGGTGAVNMRFVSPCFADETLSISFADRPDGSGRRVSIHGSDGRLACAMDWKPGDGQHG